MEYSGDNSIVKLVVKFIIFMLEYKSHIPSNKKIAIENKKGSKFLIYLLKLLKIYGSRGPINNEVNDRILYCLNFAMFNSPVQ